MKFKELPQNIKKTLLEIGWVLSDEEDLVQEETSSGYIVRVSSTVVDRRELRILLRNKKFRGVLSDGYCKILFSK